MSGYIVRRLIIGLAVLIVVSMVVFVVLRELPGDPLFLYIAENRYSSLTPENIHDLRVQYGLDRSLPVQYVDWIDHVVHGDFGTSILYRNSVASLIKGALPITISLSILAMIFSAVLGILFGALSALRRGKWLDSLVTVLANLGITAPPFWLGAIMIYVFSLYLGLLPVYGYTSPLKNLAVNLKQSIMPILVLATFPVASAARQTRSSVIEVMRQDYIRTAWAKGLSERVIIIRHVLKNALMPVVTLQGMLLRNIIGGSVVVETVFAIPGMGKLVVDGMISQDYPVVQGVILVVAVAVVISNLVIDILYGWLDPRIQYE